METTKQAALRTEWVSTETKRGMTGGIGFASQDATRRLGEKLLIFRAISDKVY